MTREEELATLISDQELDARFGHRVFSLSLNAPAVEDGESLATEDAEMGEKLLRPRSAHRERRSRHLIGYRTRYSGSCEVCGGLTDGSNGRAKAPKICAVCFRQRSRERAAARPHGTGAKYNAGCRCQECRWAAARRAWDYYHGRKATAA